MISLWINTRKNNRDIAHRALMVEGRLPYCMYVFRPGGHRGLLIRGPALGSLKYFPLCSLGHLCLRSAK